MVVNLWQRIRSLFRSKPKPEQIARQLRRPSGSLAGKIAETMDEVNAPLFDLTLASMECTDGESILEIGFGSGNYFEKLLQKADGLRVSGIDHSREMVEEAVQRNRPYIEAGVLDLRKGSSHELPYPENSFDKVFCNMVVYFWEEPGKHLAEVYRVLKPNGRFYTGLRSNSSMREFPFTKFGFSLYGRERWKSILYENGFNVQEVNEKADPKLDFEGRELQLESICIVAQKNEKARIV